MARLISDHAFRGDRCCLYPNCGSPDEVHLNSVEARPGQLPHWFFGFRVCALCGIPFNHPSHYFSPARVKVVGFR